MQSSFQRQFLHPGLPVREPGSYGALNLRAGALSLALLLSPWSLVLAATEAESCGPEGNLVVNCAFDVDVSGFQPQAGGDSIAHEPLSGNLAPGAMRVLDGADDGNNEAEAESCINLAGGQHYQVSAAFLAVVADTCLVGWDEHHAPGCGAPNGQFKVTSSIAVNHQGYSTLIGELGAGELVQSVELVILCSTGEGRAEFLVDDVLVLASPLIFADAFESP